MGMIPCDMEPGDLVVGIRHERLGMTIEPVEGAIGMVIELDPSTFSARVLYNGRVYTYFQSELRELGNQPAPVQTATSYGIMPS